MSDTTRAILMFANFLAALVGVSWVASSMGGYPFGRTRMFVVGIYIAVLLAYACYRRLVQRIRLAKVKRQRRAEATDAQQRQ